MYSKCKLPNDCKCPSCVTREYSRLIKKHRMEDACETVEIVVQTLLELGNQLGLQMWTLRTVMENDVKMKKLKSTVLHRKGISQC